MSANFYKYVVIVSLHKFTFHIEHSYTHTYKCVCMNVTKILYQSCSCKFGGFPFLNWKVCYNNFCKETRELVEVTKEIDATTNTHVENNIICLEKFN